MASTSSLPVVKHLDRQFLSCGICLERYTNPKVLPCLHTFCEHCLQSYIPDASLSVTCPICRQQSILPEQGVSALQNNFFIINLMDILENPNFCSHCETQARATSKCTDCEEFLCESCMEKHREKGATDTHHVISLSELALSDHGGDDGKTSLVCPNHDGQSLDYYCCACETAVCETCTMMEHSTHTTMPSSEAIAEHKDSLKKLLEKTQNQIPMIQEAIKSVQTVTAKLLENYKDAELRLLESFESISKLLVQRKGDMLSDLESSYNSKHQTLQIQQDSLETILASINSCSEFTENALKHGNETEILLVRKEMTEKLSQLSSPEIQKLPEENDFLSFDDSDFSTARKVITQLGSVQTNSAIAFETTASGEGMKRCYTSRTAQFTITTKDKNGDLIKVGRACFKAQIENSQGELVTCPDITDNKNGTYDLSYTVKEAGTYKIDVRLYGEPIKGSPFKVKAYSDGDSLDRTSSTTKIPRTPAVRQRGTKRPPSSKSLGSNRKSNPIEDDLIMRIGVKGRNKGEFVNPQGVCCVTDRILVADSNNQCVQLFSSSGDFKLRFGSRGRNAGQLQRPTGVAVTLNGNFLVADYDNKWVSIFGPDGKYLNKLGTGKLLGPKGVCVDNNGHIVVVDNKQSCVFVFQPNGKLVHKFGSRGNEPHQFAGPHFCAVNKNNDIIVSDFHNHCVKVFDCEGQFKFSFGSNGEGNGQFNAPTGIAVDRNGNLLVADWGNSRIQVTLSASFSF